MATATGWWRRRWRRLLLNTQAQKGRVVIHSRSVAALVPIKREKRHGPAWEAARQDGVDMSLIEAMCRKPPAQRMAVHDSALTAALRLREGMKRHHG